MTFCEIIDGLIDANDLLLEERERVPGDKRKNKYYLEARATIHQELANVEDVKTACYHESGHFAYAVLLCLKLEKDKTGFDVIGPRIKYYPLANTEPEQYDAAATALKTPELPLPRDNESLEEIACVTVAGGEAVRWFRAGQKRGNKGDYRRFKQARESAFRLLHPVSRHTIKSTCFYWKKATREVQTDFKNGKHNHLIEAKARLVMFEVFGSVFSNLNTKETR